MVTMPHSSAPSPDSAPNQVRSASLIAAGWVLGAAVALCGVGVIGQRLGTSALVEMTFLNATVVLLAAIAALLPFPAARAAAPLLAWNGLGLALSLLAFGLFRLGAFIALPVILIGLGLSALPRAEGEPLVSHPSLIALTGGALVVPGAYGLTQGFGWIAGVAG